MPVSCRASGTSSSRKLRPFNGSSPDLIGIDDAVDDRRDSVNTRCGLRVLNVDLVLLLLDTEAELEFGLLADLESHERSVGREA